MMQFQFTCIKGMNGWLLSVPPPVGEGETKLYMFPTLTAMLNYIHTTFANTAPESPTTSSQTVEEPTP